MVRDPEALGGGTQVRERLLGRRNWENGRAWLDNDVRWAQERKDGFTSVMTANLNKVASSNLSLTVGSAGGADVVVSAQLAEVVVWLVANHKSLSTGLQQVCL